jgi:hypothetical protein
MPIQYYEIHGILFSRDESKYASNLKRYKLRFEEAAEVFFDNLSSIRTDPDHSFEEERMIILGHSSQNRLLFVSFAESETIRLISARPATQREVKDYEEGY